MRIGIFGRTKTDDNDISYKAGQIGKIIALWGHVVVTGGSEWYPHIAALAAVNSWWTVLSYLTGLSPFDHAQYHDTDLSLYTELVFQEKYFSQELSTIDNYMRSLDMCLHVDIAIVIGGRVGTMYEVTLLSGLWKDVYVLENSGGITEQTIKAFITEWHKSSSKIEFFSDPEFLKDILI